MIHCVHRTRKSRRTSQNKVRINVVPVQLIIVVYVCCIQKLHNSILFCYAFLIIARKYMLFHMLVIKYIGISFK